MSIDPTASSLASAGVAYAPQIAAAAQSHHLDPTLLAAVAAQETGGPGSNAGRNIVGDGGHGHGLFQIDDRSHPFAETSAAMDPASNADYAAGMLSGLLDRYGGNVHEALSAYNTGQPNLTGTTTQWSDGSKLGYADSVLRHQQSIAAATGTSSPAAGGACAATPAWRTADPIEGETGANGASSSPIDEAIAEMGQLLSSMGQLSSQAQSLPAPTLPSMTQPQSYQRQATDYSSLFSDGDGDGDGDDD
jgi:hypothetical protein